MKRNLDSIARKMVMVSHWQEPEVIKAWSLSPNAGRQVLLLAHAITCLSLCWHKNF